jgi:peptidoglycan/xylan/chitin deacetylase (PgdA/CDA1 family)
MFGQRFALLGLLAFSISVSAETSTAPAAPARPTAKPTLQSIFNSSIRDLLTNIKNARRIQEARGSETTLHMMLHQVSRQRALKAQVSACETFSRLPITDLALLETEIDSIEHQATLGPCYLKLKQDLQSYWEGQEMKLRAAHPVEASGGAVTFRVIEKIIPTDRAQEFVTADLEPGQIMLTFDDGPHPTNTVSVLQTLKSFGAKATFFSQGSAASFFPETLRRVGLEGHAIGSHSFSHPKLAQNIKAGKFTLADALDEIRKGHESVFSQNGWIDPFFRFPHGDVNRDMKNFLRAEKVQSFLWNIDSLDWKTSDPELLVQQALAEIKRQGNRGIILFHDTKRQTALALPHILRALANQDFTLVVPVPDDLQIRLNRVPLIDSSPRRELLERRAEHSRQALGG